MKTDLKAKFLLHLNQKKQDEGFTLIELLVVIIIIGILSAIALPSFLNQANKAKQSEAKTYVGSANRAQQAYYLENNALVTITDDIGELGLGIATQTANYKYVIGKGSASSSAYQLAQPFNPKDATAKPSVKAYQGAVQVGQIKATKEATTLAVLCEAKQAPIASGPKGDASDIKFSADGKTAPDCGDLWKKLEG